MYIYDINIMESFHRCLIWCSCFSFLFLLSIYTKVAHFRNGGQFIWPLELVYLFGKTVDTLQ